MHISAAAGIEMRYTQIYRANYIPEQILFGTMKTLTDMWYKYI